jgi:hypothetical protein
VDRNDAVDPAPAKPAAAPAVQRQAGGGGAVRTTQAPRWHSFLPGMFR